MVRLNRPNGVRRGPPQPDIVGWASLPVGVVTLAERYGGTVVPREVYHAMVDEVAALVQRFADEHRGDFDDGFHMLGTSGTRHDNRRRISPPAPLRSPAGRRLLAFR